MCNNTINVSSGWGGDIYLGVWGESLVREVTFDISSWVLAHGEGTLQILVNRPGETLDTGEPLVYVATDVSVADGIATWTITDVDTAINGSGSCALVYLVGNDVVAKTPAYRTRIKDTLGHSGATVPPALEAWYNDILQASADAQSAAERAEDSLDKQPYPNAATGTWWRWNSEAGAWEDTGEPYGGGGGSLPSGGSAGQVLTKNSSVDDDATWKDLPAYAGVYEVTPLVNASTTMQTAQKYMDRDVVVREIPYQEVSNLSGGNTATIGG